MNHDTSFCADVGQVKSGNDVEDTYFKMLQEIPRVTAGVAHGIMGEYKSVRELINACRDEDGAVIADLEVGCSFVTTTLDIYTKYNKDNGKQNWYIEWEKNWPGNLQETSSIFHRAGPRFCGLVTGLSQRRHVHTQTIGVFGVCCRGNQMSPRPGLLQAA